MKNERIGVCALLCLAAACAGALEADLGPKLVEARGAWQEGDALGAEAGQVAHRGGDPIPLLDQQEAAYFKAEVAYREALKLDPQHPHALAGFGRFLITRKQMAEARLRLEAALVSPRAAQTFQPVERAEVLRALGGVLERAGLWRRAVACYRQALELQPDDPRHRISLAVALCAWGDPAAALEPLSPWSVTADGAKEMPPPLRALGCYTLAYAQEESGRPEVALAGYRRARQAALEAGPAEPCGVAEQARSAARRMVVLLRSLQAEGLQAQYTRAATLCREGARKKDAALQDPAAFATAREKLGAAQGAAEQARLRQEEPLKSFYDARRCFEEAQQAYPRYPRAHAELGFLHLALAEYRDAVSRLEAAAVYDPLAPGILAALGESRLMVGQWENALETFKKLLTVDPEYGPADLGLALAAVQLHRSERDIDLAGDALVRARLLGADPRMVVRVRAEWQDLADRLRRGEKLPAAAARPARTGRSPRTSPEPVEPWKGSILDW